jgi:hypothetical protein
MYHFRNLNAVGCFYYYEPWFAFHAEKGAGRGRGRMVVRFTTTVQPVPITTNVVSSNPVHGEVYSIQYYVIKFISDLREGRGFLQKFSESDAKRP